MALLLTNKLPAEADALVHDLGDHGTTVKQDARCTASLNGVANLVEVIDVGPGRVHMGQILRVSTSSFTSFRVD